MNTADYLLEYPNDNDIALITKKTQFTYREVREASARILGKLVALGVRPLDRVGILGDNSLFWVASYLAVLKLPAVAVFLPTVSTADDISNKIDFVESNVLLIDGKYQRKFSPHLAGQVQFITDDVLKSRGPLLWEPSTAEFSLHQDAALMLTSGTTARPRAVRITHRNIQANTDSIIEYLDLSSQERILVILPFYYCYGTSLLHTHLRVGGSLALCNTFAYPETALDMIEATGATGTAGVPSTYQTLLRNTSFPNRNLPSLKKVQQAGGKLPTVFIRELMDALPHAQIFVMYGQTEATARLSYLPPHLLKTKLGSIGKGIPGVTLRVLNDAGDEVKPGEVGEIIATGDNISPGYLNDPEASAEKFSDGHLYTGDLATVDEDGYIFIVDRKSDFIKTLGHRVSSQEVEAKILQIPYVISAAAIGVPDDLMGEAIKVFVVLQKKAPITIDDILDHCRSTLARHMIPKEIRIIDSLPMNPHGKVVKSALKNMGS
jgi:acyl-CoA synthetase (AMP-forming)/AMP-acid ligase II